MLVWRDGTRMPLDDGKGAKTFAQWLDDPDIEDMLAVPYPAGEPATPPAKDVDPGRARNEAFFDKVYGDCRKGEVERNLVNVVWLRKKGAQRLPFSKINGAAQALQAVSDELDALPARVSMCTSSLRPAPTIAAPSRERSGSPHTGTASPSTSR